MNSIARLAAPPALLIFALVFFASLARADELQDINALVKQGQHAKALERVNEYLAQKPGDAKGRFTKGLILAEQNKVAEAIEVFTALAHDYPSLPEPYNNLAVLYASQGNYDKAKSALELAIHTHPSYATAHENLGDIYAQLASRAYDRALQLDKTNTTAQLKLAMVKDIFSAQKTGAAARPTPPAAAATPVPTPAPPVDVAPTKAPPAEMPSSKAEMPKPAPAKAEVVAKAAPPTASVRPTPAPSTSAGGDAKSQAIAAVESWARAWSAKDVKGYLAHYAPDFEVPGGASRSAWEKERNERISRPKHIEVEVKVLDARVNGDEASVTFRQSYRSDALKSNNTKTLTLERSGDRWLIRQEKVGG